MLLAAMAGAIAAATPGMEAEQTLAILCYTCLPMDIRQVLQDFDQAFVNV